MDAHAAVLALEFYLKTKNELKRETAEKIYPVNIWMEREWKKKMEREKD